MKESYIKIMVIAAGLAAAASIGVLPAMGVGFNFFGMIGLFFLACGIISYATGLVVVGPFSVGSGIVKRFLDIIWGGIAGSIAMTAGNPILFFIAMFKIIYGLVVFELLCVYLVFAVIICTVAFPINAVKSFVG